MMNNLLMFNDKKNTKPINHTLSWTAKIIQSHGCLGLNG